MLNKKVLAFVLILALFFKCSVSKSEPIHIISKQAGIDITTEKVAHIVGPIDFPLEFSFEKEVAATLAIPGPRVVIIDSPGGRVDVGDRMIELMLMEKASGTKFICVASKNAHSMAFNFLSMCDVRLATADSQFVVHKIAMGGLDPDMRLSAKNLKEIADALDKADQKYRQINSKAMHLSLTDYDNNADDQRSWSAAILFMMGYLNGIAVIDEGPTL